MKDLVTLGVSWDGVRYATRMRYRDGWGAYVEFPLPPERAMHLWSSEPPEVERKWITDSLYTLGTELSARAARASILRVDGDPVYLRRTRGQLELFTDK